MTDDRLLARWRDGDTTAGDQLVRRYFPTLFKFFRTRLPDQATELTQRTLLGCVEGRDRIAAGGTFRAYMFGVARRVLLKYFEQHYQRADRFEPHRTSMHDVGFAPRAGPITVREDQRLLAAALQRLPADIQLTLELRYWWGLSLEQVAVATEVPVGTVKSRLHRGRALLREAVQSLDAPPGKVDATLSVAEGLFASPASDGPPES